MRTLLIPGLLLFALSASAQEADLAHQLRKLEDDTITVGGLTKLTLPTLLRDDARLRLRAANHRETDAWQKIRTRADWETYRDPRIEALRRSLGLERTDVPRKIRIHVTNQYQGEGYRIENLVFESRPGLWVTANLFLPPRGTRVGPGILLCHSHHNPKTQSELQDMGVLWARQGGAVLVMDQLGHGERRQHPFVDKSSYPGNFAPGRQDYHFRYNVSLQLYATGESLMGWMVHDLHRGVDVLLQHAGADRERIALFGAVAGGGDPAGVAAALDPRIGLVAPFNFGGPQPETVFPLPQDAEKAFNYAGSGSWESTRNLHLSARDGFQPWVIVGSVAPRKLIHAHEFAWDRDRDPVWKRYQKIYSLYNAPENLAVAHGRGTLSGRPPESTHCNNIGAEHRKGMYPSLKRWFGLPIPEKEPQERRTPAELQCLTPELARELKPRPARELAGELGEARIRAVRKKLEALDPAARQQHLRKEWAALLGDVEPRLKIDSAGNSKWVENVNVLTMFIQAQDDLPVPMLLMFPRARQGQTAPVVVGVCQEGKKEMLRSRTEDIAALLKQGVAVCLVDVRGTGESKPEGGRDRRSGATSISAKELMLGQPLLGSRLRDLRTVIAYLKSRKEIDPKQVMIWGDSFAPVNDPETRLEVPLDVSPQPRLAEPLGGLLAVLGALFEQDVKSAYGRGGLVHYRSLLQSPFVHVPHDAVVPGAMSAGDLDLIVETLGKRIRLEGQVDGLNRAVQARPQDQGPQWLLRK